ncbi:hypothetical protein OIV83_005282 [Microbotryomycetes sp. JL201]|nr:hypothetical protein OIV83_005282 [Microbotryomycetes sp. JL201]
MAAASALDQFEQFLAARNFYDASQKVKGVATRLLAPPRRGPQPQPDADGFYAFDQKARDACELLWTGARRLLEQQQTGSGVDLAEMLLDTWKQRGVKCAAEERAKVIQLIALTGPHGNWRTVLVNSACAWSAKTGSGPAGDPEIHYYVGQTLHKEGDYHGASLHLLLCPTQDAGRELAAVMFNWSKLDSEGPAAVGRYAARGTLSYLESEFILAARTFLSHFLTLALAAHPNLLVVRYPYPPPESPLAKQGTESGDELVVTKLASLNFLQLAVKACQAGAGENLEKSRADQGASVEKGKGRRVWQSLLQRYEKDVQWLKMPETKASTAELGDLYFEIKPPRPAGNPFADILSGMFGGTPGR